MTLPQQILVKLPLKNIKLDACGSLHMCVTDSLGDKKKALGRKQMESSDTCSGISPPPSPSFLPPQE